MKTTRRGFLKMFSASLAGAFIAPKIIMAKGHDASVIKHDDIDFDIQEPMSKDVEDCLYKTIEDIQQGPSSFLLTEIFAKKMWMAELGNIENLKIKSVLMSPQFYFDQRLTRLKQVKKKIVFGPVESGLKVVPHITSTNIRYLQSIHIKIKPTTFLDFGICIDSTGALFYIDDAMKTLAGYLSFGAVYSIVSDNTLILG